MCVLQLIWCSLPKGYSLYHARPPCHSYLILYLVHIQSNTKNSPWVSHTFKKSLSSIKNLYIGTLQTPKYYKVYCSACWILINMFHFSTASRRIRLDTLHACIRKLLEDIWPRLDEGEKDDQMGWNFFASGQQKSDAVFPSLGMDYWQHSRYKCFETDSMERQPHDSAP